MTKDECIARLNLLNIKYTLFETGDAFRGDYDRIIFFSSTTPCVGGIFRFNKASKDKHQYAKTYEELIDLGIKELL